MCKCMVVWVCDTWLGIWLGCLGRSYYMGHQLNEQDFLNSVHKVIVFNHDKKSKVDPHKILHLARSYISNRLLSE
jgi:hypothetical protein